MPFQFFKANKALRGCACGLSFNSKDQSYFISLAKQDSWNDKTRTGTFKTGAKCNLKFSMREVGGMIRAIELNEEFKMYHKSATANTQIRLGPYMAKDEEGNEVQRGFGFSVMKTSAENAEDKTSFLMPFDFAEITLLKKHLEFSLDHVFSAIYSADKQAAKEYAQKKAETETAQPEENKANDGW